MVLMTFGVCYLTVRIMFELVLLKQMRAECFLYINTENYQYFFLNIAQRNIKK